MDKEKENINERRSTMNVWLLGYKRNHDSGRLGWWFIPAVILYAIFIVGVITTFAEELPKDQVIRAIIGEASGEGERGMLAVACGIRNRGSLKGVYGVKAKHVDSQPQWVWDRAEKVWEQSATIDIVDGADHWENVKAFGVPYWAKSLTKTVKIGNHQFYK